MEKSRLFTSLRAYVLSCLVLCSPTYADFIGFTYVSDYINVQNTGSADTTVTLDIGGVQTTIPAPVGGVTSANMLAAGDSISVRATGDAQEVGGISGSSDADFSFLLQLNKDGGVDYTGKVVRIDIDAILSAIGVDAFAITDSGVTSSPFVSPAGSNIFTEFAAIDTVLCNERNNTPLPGCGGNYSFISSRYFTIQNVGSTPTPVDILSGISANYGSAIQSDIAFDVTMTFTLLDSVAVPIPPAIWLFGSGFLGLIGISRRKKA